MASNPPADGRSSSPQADSTTSVFGPLDDFFIPSVATMRQAHAKAGQVRYAVRSDEIQQRFHEDLDLDAIPSSKQLTLEAKRAGPGSNMLYLYFDDILSSEYYRSAVRPPKDQPDSTVPAGGIAQQIHVYMMVRAFNNTRGCEDNAQMVKPFTEHRHDPKLVEALCWSLLKQCMMRSYSAEPLMTAYEPSKARSSPGVDTFAQRFDQIVTALARSKTICKHLYDAPYIAVFVDDPARAQKRVNSNRDLNRQKGQVMDKGKEVLEQELKAAGGETAVKPTPRKRRATLTGLATQTPVSDKKARRATSLVVKLKSGADEDADASPTPAPRNLASVAASGFGRGAGGRSLRSMSSRARALVEADSTPETKIEDDESPERDDKPVFSSPPPTVDRQPATRLFSHMGMMMGGHAQAETYGYGNGNGSNAASSFHYPSPEVHDHGSNASGDSGTSSFQGNHIPSYLHHFQNAFMATQGGGFAGAPRLLAPQEVMPAAQFAPATLMGLSNSAHGMYSSSSTGTPSNAEYAAVSAPTHGFPIPGMHVGGSSAQGHGAYEHGTVGLSHGNGGSGVGVDFDTTAYAGAGSDATAFDADVHHGGADDEAPRFD